MLVAMKLGSVVQFCSVGVDHDKDLPGCVVRLLTVFGTLSLLRSGT